MEKIFGNYCLISLFVCMQALATVRLHVQALDGQTITQASVGQPFIVEVSITDRAGSVAEPQIVGLKNFNVRSAGYQVTMINGARSVQYRYQVRIDAPGTYRLGPALLTNPDDESSEQIIKVVEETVQQSVPSQAGKRYTQAQPAFQLTVDQDQVYVGQKVRAMVRFIISDGERINIEPFIFQPSDGITLLQLGSPEQQHIMVDGKGYNQVTLPMDLQVTKAGRVVIPAQPLDYTKEAQSDQVLGAFAAFLGARYERKRIHSNTVTLKVTALPDPQQRVDFVGTLVSFTASIDPMVAQQYEGMVFKLVFEGDAQFQSMPTPELQGVPTQLKYYPSKRDVQKVGDHQRYVCEYIVQGLQPGDYQIPPQTVTYFDVDSGTYKVQTTSPVFTTIMQSQESSAAAPSAQPKDTQSLRNDDNKMVVASPSVIAPLCTDMSHDRSAFLVYGMPWWLLLVLWILFLCIYIFNAYSVYREALIARLAPMYARRTFFTQAKKQLDIVTYNRDYSGLHKLMISLMQYAMGAGADKFEHELLNRYLAMSTWSLDAKKQWQQFMHILTERLYAHQIDEAHNHLFIQAAFWLDEFERTK